MSDQDQKLVRMANQIADYFQAYPDEQARSGIYDHIKAFWTPKMRGRLQAQIFGGAPGIHPLVAAAMQAPAEAVSPAAREIAGPAEAGELGAADAG